MRRLSLVSALLVAPLLAALPSAAAHADSTTDVGITGFRALVVDQQHGHVFISQGTSSVIVTDLQGTKVGTLTGLDGADGMTLSDDGSELFVALSQADAVAEIDTSDPFGTNAVTTFPIAPNSCPLDVAYSSGIVWVPATCDGQWTTLYSLNPSDGSVVSQSVAWRYDPRETASPALPNTIFAGDQGLSPQSVYEYTTTGGTTPTITLANSDWDTGYATRFAVESDGQHVVTGSGERYSTSNLSHAGTYARQSFANAVALRASDDLLALGEQNGFTLFKAGSTNAWSKYRFTTYPQVVDGGLAFGTTNLYAVMTNGTGYRLRVVTPAQHLPARVSVGASHLHLRYRQPVTVTASLGTGDRSAGVAIYSVSADSTTRHLLAQGHFDGHGHFQTTARLTKTSQLIAVVQAAGKYDSATATRRVTVAADIQTRFLRANGHAGRYTLFHPKKNAYLLGKVLPDHLTGCETFHVQFHVQGHWGYDAFTPCASLQVQSEAIGYVQGDPRLVGIPIRMRAQWGGDSVNTKKNSPWRYCKFVRGSGRTAADGADRTPGRSVAARVGTR
jgi:hypothetical protein